MTYKCVFMFVKYEMLKNRRSTYKNISSGHWNCDWARAQSEHSALALLHAISSNNNSNKIIVSHFKAQVFDAEMLQPNKNVHDHKIPLLIHEQVEADNFFWW